MGTTTEITGWTEDIGECRTPADLPRAAKEYLDYVADFTGVPIMLVGVGPARDQVVWMQDRAAVTA